MCRQVADYSRQCWIVFFVLFGNSVEKIPEGYKRDFVNGLRENLGSHRRADPLIDARGQRESLRAEEAAGRREVLSATARLDPAIHAMIPQNLWRKPDP
jgi:hypothetical protein